MHINLLIINLLFYFINRKIINKYGRENNNNDQKFTVKRCEEDGDEGRRHHVYLINERDKTYQRVEDTYTLNKLGYGAASRKDKTFLFSKNDYKIEKRIKVRKILILDIIDVLIKIKDLTK